MNDLYYFGIDHPFIYEIELLQIFILKKEQELKVWAFISII